MPVYMTTNTGTPKSMPQKPNSPPPSMIANITQKPFMPTEPPIILGQIMLPSTCWRATMNMTNIRHLKGSTISTKSPDGTPPMNGPKNGMTFVAPTTTAMSSA